MRRPFPYLAEALTLVALIAAPFILPHLGFTPSTINRILIWGMVGIGFDLLFGYTGLLSFGQSAFFGTGGMFAAYLLTETSFDNTVLATLERAYGMRDDPEIGAHLGEVLWALGRKDDAQKLLRAAQKKHPDNEPLADAVKKFAD